MHSSEKRLISHGNHNKELNWNNTQAVQSVGPVNASNDVLLEVNITAEAGDQRQNTFDSVCIA